MCLHVTIFSFVEENEGNHWHKIKKTRSRATIVYHTQCYIQYGIDACHASATLRAPTTMGSPRFNTHTAVHSTHALPFGFDL